MPFQFTCPYCFKKTLVSETLVGEKGPCAGCGKIVTVQAPPNWRQSAMASSELSPENRLEAPVRLPPRGSQTAPKWSNRRGLVLAAKAAGGLCLVVGLLALVTVFAWPLLQSLKARRDKVACMNNLQRIATALNTYADRYGSYPPPAIVDAQGTPMHSWRVLILEQLGEHSLYAQYDFEQPWDSPQNSALMALCPSVYVSPGNANWPLVTESNYVLVTGGGTLFPPGRSLAPSEILDGAGSTVLVVETENRLIPWTQPWDIERAKLNPRIGATGNNAIGGNHEGGATAVTATGRSLWLPADLSPELLDGLLTPDGREPINPEDYRLQ